MNRRELEHLLAALEPDLIYENEKIRLNGHGGTKQKRRLENGLSPIRVFTPGREQMARSQCSLRNMPEQRILLIEDEPTTREIFSYVLREAGYVADAVGSAGAATTCLNTIQYTLVIADWLLPDGNGIDLADAACDRGAKTLIISSILSSLPSGAAERHELLTKPLAADEILAAVRRAIGNPDAKHG